MDGGGRDLSTGRSPRAPGRPSPAAALAAAPVVTWPMGVVAGDGRRLSLGRALGPGGQRVEALLAGVTGRSTGPDAPGRADVDPLARLTPAGPVTMPVCVVPLPAGVEAAARVDPTWLAEVDRRRAAPRHALVAAGRGEEMEAALHVAMLVATERLDPADDVDVDAHVASGALLWLLAGAVVSAQAYSGVRATQAGSGVRATQAGSGVRATQAGAEADPFAAWARLVVTGWWPVGPSGGRLVVTPLGASVGVGDARDGREP